MGAGRSSTRGLHRLRDQTLGARGRRARCHRSRRSLQRDHSAEQKLRRRQSSVIEPTISRSRCLTQGQIAPRQLQACCGLLLRNLRGLDVCEDRKDASLPTMTGPRRDLHGTCVQVERVCQHCMLLPIVPVVVNVSLSCAEASRAVNVVTLASAITMNR